MLRVRGEISTLKFDRAKYKKAVEQRLTALTNTAAKAFVHAMYARIPVYTGMARASVRPLANYLGVTVPISPVNPRPVKGKSISSGYSKGSFEFSYGPKVYYMLFRSSVFHYWLNENFNIPIKNLKRKTPWNSILVGQRAFQRVIDSGIIGAIPPLRPFIIKTTKRIN